MRQSSPPLNVYSSTYVKLLFDYLSSKGLDAQCILGEAAPDPNDRGLVRYSSVRWRRLLERASSALEDPLLGLHLGSTITPAHLGVLGYVMMACQNGGAALLRWQQFETLISDVAHLRMRMEGTSVVLEWLGASERQGSLADDAAVTALVQFARGVMAKPLVLEEVCFVNSPPKNVEPYREYFKCPVRFDQPETLIRGSVSNLIVPLRQADDALLGYMELQAKALLAELPLIDDLEQAVRRAIARLAREGEISIERVAGEMNQTPRSLHRKLARLGCHFRGLREDTRRRMALDYLDDPRLTLSEVAWLLGYSELSAFSRAFKRWTGQSPREAKSGV